MLKYRRRSLLVGALLGATMLFLAPVARSQGKIPERLSDKEFWQIVTEMSEVNGYFSSDNFLSNESAYQIPIPELVKHGTGGVYFGVAAEQNFTYFVALKPRIAFIFDIRRGNLLEHLVYKALFEMSADRVQFVTLLFSRAPNKPLKPKPTIYALLASIDSAPPDTARYKKTLADVTELLEKKHGFTLSASDRKGLEYVFTAFMNAGTSITYNTGIAAERANKSGVRAPNFHDLMVQFDNAKVQHGFLVNDENFNYVKDLEARNLVVPLVGDFAGKKAIRAAGAWVKERGASVSWIYTSNVEQYLFQSNVWKKYYENVATLPLDDKSLFIRSVFNIPAVYQRPGIRSASLLCPVKDVLKAVAEGKTLSYADVVAMSK